MALQIPNLDDKTFDRLFEEANSLIARYAPEWTDHNLHDPGITFLDLFAWLAEMQIYSLNRVTDKQNLKFLQLVDIRPQPAKPAQVPVTFAFETSDEEPISNKAPFQLEKGAQLAGQNPDTGEDVVFETDEKMWVSPIQLQAILTENAGGFSNNTAANAHDGLFYYAFGETPQKDDALYIGFRYHRAFPAVKTRLWINLYEKDLPAKIPLPADPPEIFWLAELAWEYWAGDRWKALKNIDDKTYALTQNGSITFDGPSDATTKTLAAINEPLYWIRARLLSSEYTIPPRIDSALLNTVTAMHGRTLLRDGVQIRFSSDGLPNQVFLLKTQEEKIQLPLLPVLYDSEALEVQDSTGAWQRWQRVVDFDNSGPRERHYTMDLLQGEIIFGDGIHGRIPPKGQDNIRISSLRSGGGVIGNLNAGAIDELVSATIHGVTVTNITPAVGGREAESIEEAVSAARKDMKKTYRSVTSKDFETLAFTTPGMRVARAKALPGFHPCYPCFKMSGVVSVVVIPHTLRESNMVTPKPGRSFLRAVYMHLQQARLLTTNLFVIAPDYIKVAVKAEVKMKPKNDPGRVRSDIEKGLREYLDPVAGGPEKAGWPFGREVLKSEILQVISKVAGVNCVNALAFQFTDQKSCAKLICDNVTIPRNGVVYSGTHEIRVME